MRLQGKRVLVTGAGAGLGYAITRELASIGADVIITDIDATRAAAAAAEFNAPAYPLDVTSHEQIAAVRDQVHGQGGPIDALINNAGVVFGGPFLDVSMAHHAATIRVNLTGLLGVTHAFLPDLIGRPEAHLVNVASAAAFVPLPDGASYAATKAAVASFSDSLREELRLQGHHHVGITAACPSFMATGLFRGARPVRLTWMLEPERVARAIVQAIERRRELIVLPWTARLLYSIAGLLPGPAHRALCAGLGVSTSMRQWRGHGPAVK